jgi:hypothetical protein
MGRKNLGPRTAVLVRFDPDLLQAIDAWEGAPDRGAKIQALLRLALKPKSRTPRPRPASDSPAPDR